MEASLLSDSITNYSSTCCSEVSTDTESSWTPYIVDFVIHNNTNNVGSLSEYDDSMTSEETSKQQQLKKRKKTTNQVVDDEALEDTASSPDNSPKVFCIGRQDDGSYRTKRDHPLNFKNILEHENIFVERKERSELCINIEDSTATALKKKGLRLVPVSMLIK